MDDLRTRPLTRSQINDFITSERGVRSYEGMQFDITSQYEALTSASFLVVNSEPTLGSERTLTIGTGLHGTDGGPNSPFTIINTAPDLVVTLTGAGTTAVTGTYPNFTITSNDQFAGTVTSVGASVPTGFSIANSPVTTSGTLAITYAAGYQGYTTAEATKLGLITSGTYNPTLTHVAGIDASTTHEAHWLRVGSVVHVFGRIDIDPTTTGGGVAIGISLPVASAFTSGYDLSGTMSGLSSGYTMSSGAIFADTVNDRAQLEFVAQTNSNTTYMFSFGYRII